MPQARADEVEFDEITTREADAEPDEQKGKLGQKLDELKAKYPWLDHLMRAGERYTERNGDMYAASITYLTFLALFPILLLAVAVFGFVMRGNPQMFDDINKSLAESVPGGAGDLIANALTAARDQATGIGIISLVLVAYTGTGWVSNLRKATQEMWGQPHEKQPFVKQFLGDLGTLVGLGLALVVSIGLSTVAGDVTTYLVKLIGLDHLPGAFVLMKIIAIAAALIADVLLFLYIIVTLPRQKLPFRAVLRGALFGAIGFEILKVVGTIYIPRVAASPAAGVFGAVLGLLVWINLMSRLMLVTITWTATSRPVLEIRRAEAEALGIGSERTQQESELARLQAIEEHRRNAPYSPGVVLGVLLAAGAVVGSLIPGFIRRWWDAERT
ncbi:membrane protein [Antricoccus suffuscus]|uniref:Membrane protein n=1 Tax=Antricoccus suffuscus TaxID=1629062 RepID=A0A2T0ZG00_9ACTN|nr:YhjD/YihY/BrkB family envelope integrity protein [Antricoccus suffuscus]PRZ35231.1 membrane protein [Antricoccus suffuscus]